jgi:hypothetical protein
VEGAVVAAAEQGRHLRYDACLPVVCRAVARTEEAPLSLIGMTRNVSLGGLQAELPAAPPEGAVEILLRVGERAVTVQGRLAWSRPVSEGIRCGFAFIEMEAGHAAVWEAFLAQQGGPTPRLHGRLAMDLSITCRLRGRPGRDLAGRLGNVSDGGMLVRLPAPLEVGQEMDVTLLTPETPLVVSATVAWGDRAPLPDEGGLIRHGLRFLPPVAEGALRQDLFLARALLAEYLRQTGAAPVG